MSGPESGDEGYGIDLKSTAKRLGISMPKYDDVAKRRFEEFVRQGLNEYLETHAEFLRPGHQYVALSTAMIAVNRAVEEVAAGESAAADRVFVVVGSRGQYDEYREWNVAVFLDVAVANQYAQNAQAWGNAASEHFRKLALHWNDQDRWLNQNPSPYDCDWYVGGTNYSAQAVPLAPGKDPLAVAFTPKRFRRTKEPK